ncbi:hypothetical protein MPTK1_7g19650 [Marchantia polymorpha subsp. ruderalis]|uniref:Uncharacterized protein n=2 Tax=Marchantia polymorpha TaxID=3197 RepID=A0AAF6C1I2_MARPO|nr:hypothetical protein MARPO_0067s0012 [Marchantia polymorpha]BBN18116.1 hypothetical protein Mp_7g19650 [Marchantia polymorpha subsp. ruderalis]|eukprot:PTQ35918.1 hypothetical protein MARPO_0067s0012 [Marchantia polymorpha]
MQGWILQSAALQDVTHGCALPNPFFSKSRLHSVQERKRIGVCSMSRKGPQTLKFCSELRRDSREGELAEISPALNENEFNAEASTRFLENSEQNTYSSTGTAALPPVVLRQINFTDRHLLLLGFIACATTGALSCILLAAIPTLIAFKKAADSLKKLADTAREELPGTMAAVRLSGMEISDLTMELSDLGQEISEGVRSSTRAVRAAEDGLRRMGSFTSIGEGNRASAGGETKSSSRSKKHPGGTGQGS